MAHLTNPYAPADPRAIAMTLEALRAVAAHLTNPYAPADPVWVPAGQPVRVTVGPVGYVPCGPRPRATYLGEELGERTVREDEPIRMPVPEREEPWPDLEPRRAPQREREPVGAPDRR